MAILEISDDGVLHVPGELLARGRPHARFELDVVGDIATLRPVDPERPFWERATPAERAEAFRRWAESMPPDTPDVPSESLRREAMYD
jgi:hypothetical protein